MREEDRPLHLEKHLKLRSDLSTVQSSSILDIWRAAPSGKKLSACKSFLAARMGPGKLSSGEFIQFGFPDGQADVSEIGTFAGKQAQQAFNRVYNDKTWYAVTKNKIAFEALMKGGGMPCPQTIAIYDRKGRGAGAPVLKTTDELFAFLSDETNHPVFCKPTTGLLSIGSFRIDGAAGNNLIVNGSHEYTIEEVTTYIQGISKKGYLFQKVLEPHADFQKIDCEVISSVRFLVLNREERAEIHSCVLKVAAKGEVADNFWRTGSIIAAIDLKTGKPERAVFKSVGGTDLLKRGNSETKNLFDLALPDFEVAKNIVVAASRFLAGVRVQSWDVALTKRGPVLLEVNFGGDLNLSQLSSGRGIMDKRYCDVLREAGYNGRLPN